MAKSSQADGQGLDNGKAHPKITFPKPLFDRARNAAYAEGYTGERDFSNFICMVVQEWIADREQKRGDKAYPNAPNISGQ